MKHPIAKLCAMLLFNACMSGCGNADVNKAFEKAADRELVHAALRGDRKRIEVVLSRGETNINCEGADGTTPLLYAVMAKNKGAVALLLKMGANPNLQDNGGYSPMSFSARLADTWFLETMLKNGGNVNLQNIRKETPIFQAIDVFSIHNMAILIKAGANLDIQDESGATPMLYAADINRFDIVYYLLQQGADPKIEDNWGRTVYYPIQHNGIDPDSPLAKDRDRVIAWLKERNLWRIEEKRKAHPLHNPSPQAL